MDRGVDVGSAGFNAAVEDVHVHESGANVDDDLCAGLADEGRDVCRFGCVQLVSFKNALLFHRALLTDGLKDRLTLGKRPARDMDIAKHIVVLRALVRHDLSDATSADDEYVLFQLNGPPLVYS